MKIRFLFFSTSIALCITSCHFTPESSAPPTPVQNSPFSNLNYHDVSAMTIAVHLPETGTHFTTDLKYTGPEETDWEIASSEFLDRHADGFFIRHLLDTLHTLRIAEEPSFKNSNLSDLGLSPPRYAIRWSLPDGKPYEILIGNKLKNEGQAYALLQSNPTIISGAVIKMLDYLKSLETLRQKTFVRFSSDDIDEVEIYQRQNHARNKVFNAERYSKAWKKNQIDKQLTSFAHTRVQSYIDDAEMNSKILKQIRNQPLAEMIVKDRQGKPIQVQITRYKNQFYGTTSERSQAAFLLYPEITRYFKFQK